MSFQLRPLSQLVTDGRIQYGIVQPGVDTPGGVPIVRVKDLGNGILDPSSPARVSPEISAKHGRTILEGREVLVSLVGSVGIAAITTEEVRGWNVARAIAVLRPLAAVGPEWLHLCLRSSAVQNQIREMLNTTVQATLNLADLKDIKVPVPDARVRHAIAAVLGALDDKIVANTALARTADELSRLRYSLIKSGSEVALSDLANFINGKAFTNGATGTGRVVIRIAELNSGLGASTVYNEIEVSEDHLAKPGDLLFAWSGSLTVHRWFREGAIINQHIFKVVPKAGFPIWLIHQALLQKLTDFRSIASDKATTMGHIQRRHLDEQVAVPSPEQIANNSDFMTALWGIALSAEQENLILADLRDTLLPQLMSGKLRVRDAERQVEDVV